MKISAKKITNLAVTVILGLVFYFWSPHAPNYADKQVTRVVAAKPQILGEKTSATDDTYIVTRVVDGDTILLSNHQKVRYIGVDTPETVSPKKPVQCFGHEASLKNKELVEGQEVRLERDISDTDRYGRWLRYVYLADGTFVNLELVKLGYARPATFPPDVAHAEDFVAASRLARENKLGLWSACN